MSPQINCCYGFIRGATVVWKDINQIGKRFCSKECSGVFYNESMEWLLNKRQEYEIKRAQLNKANK